MKYLMENDLFPDLQSAYRSNHSTETAVLKVLSDILLALDSGIDEVFSWMMSNRLQLNAVKTEVL